jgi:hypothetical protein
MLPVQTWCQVTLVGPDGAELVRGALEGPGDPDLRMVEEVARLMLAARHLGAGVRLGGVMPVVRELLELSGLGVEVQWQAEGGEEGGGLGNSQEEGQPGDLPA